jgi:hypothetical protein
MGKTNAQACGKRAAQNPSRPNLQRHHIQHLFLSVRQQVISDR